MANKLKKPAKNNKSKARVYHNTDVDTSSNDGMEQKTLVAGSDNRALDRVANSRELSAVNSFKKEVGDEFVDDYDATDDVPDYYDRVRQKAEQHKKDKDNARRKQNVGLTSTQIARNDKIRNYNQKLADSKEILKSVDGNTAKHYGSGDLSDELYDESVTAEDFYGEAMKDHAHEKRRKLPNIDDKKEPEDDRYDYPGAKTINKYS